MENFNQFPDREFLTLLDKNGSSQTLNYGDLIKRSFRWLRLFNDRGLRPGDKIVIILQHGIDLYASFIGALIGGMVPAQFAFPSPKFSDEEYFKTIDKLLENANGKLIVLYPELRKKLEERELTIQLSGGFCSAFELPEQKEFSFEEIEVNPEDTAFLQYSSGTTGIKKGVAISHNSLLWQVEAYAKAISLKTQDIIVSWLPIYHDMGLICCLFLPLLKGVKLVAMSPFDWVRRPMLWVQAVHDFKATLSWQPNFAYTFLSQNIKDEDLSSVSLSSLRGLINCSEPILARSHSAFCKKFTKIGFKELSLGTSYAMAENTFAVTSGGIDEKLAVEWINEESFSLEGLAIPVEENAKGGKQMVSSGKALPATQIEIVDENGKCLPDRRVGEIALKSPSMMTEYYSNPEATNLAIRQEKYFSGDLGYLADGELFVTGRKKDLIIIGGHNVYPQDIEFLLNDIDGLIAGRCVALGLRDDELSTEKLIVIAESSVSEKAKQLLKEEIYKIIAERTSIVASDILIVPRKWLVKSTAGKISRSGNLEKYKSLSSALNVGSPIIAITEMSNSPEYLSLVREAVHSYLKSNHQCSGSLPKDDDPLISNGLIDSFGTLSFIQFIEKSVGQNIPPSFVADIERMDSIRRISECLGTIEGAEKHFEKQDTNEIPMTYATSETISSHWNFWTIYYKILFKIKKISYGKGFKVLGPLILEINGNPKNIIIGKNVTLMPGVHLKNREDGKIVLHNEVKLDSHVRLVVANQATIELGQKVVLGMGSVFNAGVDIKLGRGTISAVNCLFNASDHEFAKDLPIRNQPYLHEPIFIGEDVWIGANCMIMRGSQIDSGSIISAQSLVRGFFPSHVVVGGNPARIIKQRV